jgi:3-hydroxyacyl-CoA dehydrogenase
MPRTIRRAAVIGAGTMGAAIAAHLANAGIPTYLLDIVPRELTAKEQAQGLTLESAQVRNRIANQGLMRAKKSKPASFFNEDATHLITVGNLEDHFDWIGEADWVIEAVIERMDIKQSLMARIDVVRKEDAIVSSNTSGLPIHAIAEGRSESFRSHFLGTHFFNPPRYMKLLEVIPTPDTDPQVVTEIIHFGEERLGKGIVLSNDTPNFIGNRLAFIAFAHVFEFALSHDYTVAEVDYLTGPLIGRPKTGTFRLSDLVGVDILYHIAHNLYDLLPHDPEREILKAPQFSALLEGMMERKWLGNKTKIGFSKQMRGEGGKKEYWQLNLKTMTHEPPQKARFESLKAIRKLPLAQRLPAVAQLDDRAGQFLWHTLSRSLSYAAAIIPEVSSDPMAVDNAMKWGFGWEIGPFETWDMLGVAETAARMEAEGIPVAAWVKEMLAQGGDSFYRTHQGQKQRWLVGTGYANIETNPKLIILDEWKQQENRVIATNPSASLVDLGDGVLLLEFHAKTPTGRVMNMLDTDVFTLVQEAMSRLETSFDGLVIGNQGEFFSAGANVFLIAMNAQQGNWDTLDELSRYLQNMRQVFTGSAKPIVAAPFGVTLGGGTEISMSADRIVAAAETYMGLPEVGVGIIPAGGGTKELVRRVISPAAKVKHPGIQAYVQKAALTIAMATISTSAAEARDLGFLSARDRIVMNKDFLIAEAKNEVLAMLMQGYHPTFEAKNCYATGRDLYAVLEVFIEMQKEAGYISEHDGKIARKLSYVLTGGNITRPQWVDEQYILDLEREAFLSLAGEALSQARMWHMLQTGKPLRN